MAENQEQNLQAKGFEKQQKVAFSQKKQEEKPALSADGKEIRGIVRIAGKDLKGHWSVPKALRSIKGIGINLGQVISAIVISKLNLKPTTMIGELDEEQLKKLEEIITNPQKFGVPTFMLNRQRDYVEGQPQHLIATDLAYATKQDIEHEKESYTWRGFRHAYGQKVRGQHTRSTGRSGMTVGVIRKAVAAKAGAAAQQQAGKEEKQAKPAQKQQEKK